MAATSTHPSILRLSSAQGRSAYMGLKYFFFNLTRVYLNLNFTETIIYQKNSKHEYNIPIGQFAYCYLCLVIALAL